MYFKRTQYRAIYKGSALRITADLLTESLKSRRAYNNVFQTLEGNNCQLKLLFKANISGITSSILSEHNGIKPEIKGNICNFVEVEQHTIKSRRN